MIGEGTSDKRSEIREADARDRVARIRAAKSFSDGMLVATADGKNGKVCGVNLRTGSIDVRVEGVPRPQSFAATALTKR